MICKNCGNEISQKEEFCSKCGARITVENSFTEAGNDSKGHINSASCGKPKGEKMSANKIMAIVSSILLVVCIPLKLISGSYGSLSIFTWLASLGIGIFGAYIIYVLLFITAFLAGMFTRFRKLRILGCIGIWIETAFLAFTVLVVAGSMSSAYGTSYTVGLGFYILLLGVILQAIAAFKK